MEDHKLKEIFNQYLEDRCDAEQAAILFQHFNTADESYLRQLIMAELETLDENVADARLHTIAQDVYINIDRKIKEGNILHKKQTRRLWYGIAAAAAVLFVIGTVLYLQTSNYFKQHGQYADDVKPGKNSATLTLADGKKIILSDVLKGELATEAGVSISKTKEGQLVYEVKDNHLHKLGQVKYNTLSTARAEQYMVILPDQSKVYMNAASSLRFPATFANLKQRRVELNGEAYFEVSKDKAHPFVVVSNKQEVEVLGTHFNINSYADEASVKTTLLEGSVRVALHDNTDLSASGSNRFRILKPEQQSILSGDAFNVINANVEEVVAWKNGYFRFNDESIPNIMRQISRWYDVEIYYQDKVTTEGLNGRISRFKNIGQVLKMLEDTELVHFKVEGRRITVMK